MNRALLVEEDFITRVELTHLLNEQGIISEVAVDESEGFQALELNHTSGRLYSLVIVPIALFSGKLGERLRMLGHAKRSATDGFTTIVLTTRVKESADSVLSSFQQGCDGILALPPNEQTWRQFLFELENYFRQTR